MDVLSPVALAAPPPQRITARLEVMRDQTDIDAANLNVRLRELVVLPDPTAGTAIG